MSGSFRSHKEHPRRQRSERHRDKPNRTAKRMQRIPVLFDNIDEVHLPEIKKYQQEYEEFEDRTASQKRELYKDVKRLEREAESLAEKELDYFFKRKDRRKKLNKAEKTLNESEEGTEAAARRRRLRKQFEEAVARDLLEESSEDSEREKG
ncbi:hypothetical protein BJ508DRAFT_363948 [Ascobolus immersus RN42]|uniref:Uncharacterized protein n=1 Tax=Ascobolus immersus RN42 TaxID=1160509 RepID=A0A3N4I231_ASCIM|nr:hypothetical protein BJ508DRAFT_363948 [Ascobolus immersus RN42]